jgi:hypothetical protein
MPGAPVIPNSQIVRPPFKSHLRVVVLRYQTEQIRQDEIGLVFTDAIDALREAFVHIHRFPTRHGLR